MFDGCCFGAFFRDLVRGGRTEDLMVGQQERILMNVVIMIKSIQQARTHGQGARVRAIVQCLKIFLGGRPRASGIQQRRSEIQHLKTIMKQLSSLQINICFSLGKLDTESTL